MWVMQSMVWKAGVVGKHMSVTLFFLKGCVWTGPGMDVVVMEARVWNLFCVSMWKNLWTFVWHANILKRLFGCIDRVGSRDHLVECSFTIESVFGSWSTWRFFCPSNMFFGFRILFMKSFCARGKKLLLTLGPTECGPHRRLNRLLWQLLQLALMRPRRLPCQQWEWRHLGRGGLRASMIERSNLVCCDDADRPWWASLSLVLLRLSLPLPVRSIPPKGCWYFVYYCKPEYDVVVEVALLCRWFHLLVLSPVYQNNAWTGLVGSLSCVFECLNLFSFVEATWRQRKPFWDISCALRLGSRRTTVREQAWLQHALLNFLICLLRQILHSWLACWGRWIRLRRRFRRVVGAPPCHSPWTGLIISCVLFYNCIFEIDLRRQMNQARPAVPLGGWSSLVPQSPNRHRVTLLFRNVVRGYVFLGSLLAQWVRLANLCIQSIGSVKSFCWKFWIESNELNWYFKLEAIGLRSWDDGSICSIVDFTWRLGPRWTAVRDQAWLTNVFCVCCNLTFWSRPPVWAAATTVQLGASPVSPGGLVPGGSQPATRLGWLLFSVVSVIMSCHLARPETPREVSAVDQREMIQQLQQVDTTEKKRNAEAGRGAKWCEQAQPEKRGKARREIIPYHCMPEIPDLLEAGRICLNLCFLSLCCFVFVLGNQQEWLRRRGLDSVLQHHGLEYTTMVDVMNFYFIVLLLSTGMLLSGQFGLCAAPALCGRSYTAPVEKVTSALSVLVISLSQFG